MRRLCATTAAIIALVEAMKTIARTGCFLRIRSAIQIRAGRRSSLHREERGGTADDAAHHRVGFVGAAARQRARRGHDVERLQRDERRIHGNERGRALRLGRAKERAGGLDRRDLGRHLCRSRPSGKAAHDQRNTHSARHDALFSSSRSQWPLLATNSAVSPSQEACRGSARLKTRFGASEGAPYNA